MIHFDKISSGNKILGDFSYFGREFVKMQLGLQTLKHIRPGLYDYDK